jgi:AsmA-like protein
VIHRRRWIWLLTGLAAGLVVALVMVAATLPLSSDSLRQRIVAELSRRLDADIELGDLELRLFPRFRAAGETLRVRQHGNGDEPIISVEHFTIDADLSGLVRKRVARVRVVGLKIVIPPQQRRHSAEEPIATSGAANDPIRGDLVIDRLESDDAHLIIEPTPDQHQKAKQPHTWTIHHLVMRNVGAKTAMPFDATLTNAVPPGEIVTAGHFGPWHPKQPGDTPLDGTFTFDHADLNVFHGIGGTLSSRGRFGGTLDVIDVTGESDTPDFVVDVGGQPLPLHTKYHTIVDGMNGDTRLVSIDAAFLQSSLVARGRVYNDTMHLPGRFVDLDIRMDRGRIEDVMRMAVKPPPPMVGALKMTTKFHLPPGESDVIDRLRLDGTFTIAGARFTNVDVQGKIEELSRRSRGQPIANPQTRVFSNFDGHFAFGGGALNVPDLMFTVPGAKVQLAGRYALKPETLDFRGTMLMDASISDTQSGWKNLMLKVVDPMFRRKEGGSAVPFKITGKRRDPQFGLDFGRLFKRGNTP